MAWQKVELKGEMDSVPIEQRLSEFRARKVQKKSLSTPSTAPFFRGLRNA